MLWTGLIGWLEATCNRGIPSIALRFGVVGFFSACVVASTLLLLGFDGEGFDEPLSPWVAVLVLVVAPLVESVVLLLGYLVLRRVPLLGDSAAMVSGALIACWHGTVSVIWGLAVAPAFLLQGFAMQRLATASLWRAFAAVTLIHVVNNSLSTGLSLLVDILSVPGN